MRLAVSRRRDPSLIFWTLFWGTGLVGSAGAIGWFVFSEVGPGAMIAGVWFGASISMFVRSAREWCRS